MRTRKASVNLSTGEYTDQETGKVYSRRSQWVKDVDRETYEFWERINLAASPDNEVEYNLPKRLSKYDMRWGLYKDDLWINTSNRGRVLGGGS